MSSTPLASSYRSILREVQRSSRSPRTTRSKVVSASFRQLFDGAAKNSRNGNSAEVNKFKKQMDDAVTFMKGQREYQELLKRYNPLHDMSPEEHRQATAHRVGLNMPKAYSEE